SDGVCRRSCDQASHWKYYWERHRIGGETACVCRHERRAAECLALWIRSAGWIGIEKRLKLRIGSALKREVDVGCAIVRVRCRRNDCGRSLIIVSIVLERYAGLCVFENGVDENLVTIAS